MRDAKLTAGVRARTPTEMQAVMALQRAGVSFLMHRVGGDDAPLSLQELSAAHPQVSIGRHASCDVALSQDPSVSRVHAVLEWLGGAWTVNDDGISTNGTFVNGVRVQGSRRLRDGDELLVGATSVRFCDATEGGADSTVAVATATPVKLTDGQRRVLVELCRPLLEPHAELGTLPAGNQAIADALVVGVEAVRSQLRGLYSALDVDDLPHNQKRAALAAAALQRRLVSRDDVRG